MGSQVTGRADQFFGPAPASGGGPRFEPAVKFGVVGQDLRHFGDKIARPDAVHLDVVSSPIDGHGFGEHLNPALGGRIGPHRYPPHFAHKGTDVDDLAGPALDHAGDHLLAGQEDARQVDIQHLLPGRLIDALQGAAPLNAGVVHQDVNMADLVLYHRYLFPDLLLGAPVLLAIGVVALLGILITPDLVPAMFPQKMFTMLDSFSLLAMPYFILAGELMARGGLSRKMVQFGETVVGHLRGGLGHASIFSCMIFANVSGSATAATSAIGSILLPSMKERGYKPGFSASLLATSGIIGSIIPPSMVMIVYGAMAGVSIGGAFPGRDPPRPAHCGRAHGRGLRPFISAELPGIAPHSGPVQPGGDFKIDPQSLGRPAGAGDHTRGHPRRRIHGYRSRGGGLYLLLSGLLFHLPVGAPERFAANPDQGRRYHHHGGRHYLRRGSSRLAAGIPGFQRDHAPVYSGNIRPADGGSAYSSGLHDGHDHVCRIPGNTHYHGTGDHIHQQRFWI
ncbi:hypothetical protein ES703_119143 [subsurface metagenome]